MKPVSLHAPPDAPGTLRMTLTLTGDLAAQIRSLAAEYQTPPSTIVRELAVDGLRARRRMREAV